MSTPAVAQGNGSLFERGVVVGGLALLLVLPRWLDTSARALAAMVPIAIACVDFLSGLVHWAFDHHVSPKNRVLGRFVVDFLDHHERPSRTLEVGFAKSAFRSTAFVALPLGAAAAATHGHPHATALLYGLALLSVFGPQLHKLAHLPHPPRVVRWLQDAGLILGRRAHARHHQEPQDRAFCIATGWCNPLLDATRFWRGMDALAACARRSAR